MKIMEIFSRKQKNNSDHPGVTIAFLGDSVTQGCFEVYRKDAQTIETVFDQAYGYHHQLAHLLSILYPSVPVNIINSGISGGKAPHGLQRLERDVLRHAPDLVVVCFGLNDAMAGMEAVGCYLDALEKIILCLQDKKVETIFMTPNMMCTRVDHSISDPLLREAAEDASAVQNGGILDSYLQGARDLCQRHDIRICDCYQKWKVLHQNGVDVTSLLANLINHPTRQMNKLFAISLLETMMQ